MPDALPTRTGSRPILTLAIPTYNRGVQIAQFLDTLLPQVKEFPGQIQVIVSDNASSDHTAKVIASAAERFLAAGVPLEAWRHETNVGMDRNFLTCWERARGHFYWMCGDDDIIVPGALAEVMSHLRDTNGHAAEIDLIYATSYGYRTDYSAERQADPLGRSFHSITNVHTLIAVVGMMFTFVSGMVVNKDRLEQIPHEESAAFVGTFLLQLSWVLPLLLHFRKAVVLWNRPVAARQGHANGYSLGKVFGRQLEPLTARLLPGRPDLSRSIVNSALRRWFPSILLEIRAAGDPSLRFDEAPADLRKAFGRNPRFWLFTWPVLTLPLPLARLWQKAGALLSKAIYIATVPNFWRKQT